MSWSVLFLFFSLLLAGSVFKSHAGLFRLLLICGLLEIVWGGIEMGGWWQWVRVVSGWDSNLFKYFLIALGLLLLFSVQVVVACGNASYVTGFLSWNLVLSLLCLSPLARKVVCHHYFSFKPTFCTVLWCLTCLSFAPAISSFGFWIKYCSGLWNLNLENLCLLQICRGMCQQLASSISVFYR